MNILHTLKFIFIFIFILIFVPTIAAQTTIPKKLQIKIKEVTPVESQKIKATIEWESTASQDHYYEIFSKTGTEEYASLGNLAVSPLVLTFAEDRPFFSIKIREITAKGAGEFSNEVAVQWNRSVLTAPANVTIQKQSGANDSIEAVIKWNSVPRATKYHVYTIFNGNKQKIGETYSTESKVSFSRYGTNFGIAVSAANEYSESELSTQVAVEREQYVNPTSSPTPTPKTASALTGAPANLRILSQKIENEKKHIELIWDNLPSSSGYTVYISTNGEFNKLSSVSLNSVIITVPMHFMPFKVAVKGINEKGESPMSHAIEIKDEDARIEIQFTEDSQVTPAASVTPTPEPKEVLEKIEIKESKPKDQPVSILGTSVKGDLGPNIEKKQENGFAKSIASIFSAIINFFTGWLK